MRQSSKWGLCLLALLALSARAAKSSPPCDRVERYTLPNGLEVVLAQEPTATAVAVVSSVHVGARHDPPGYEGLAHYVEHLACRSSPPFASAMELYADAGAVGINATTDLDRTEYYAVIPAAQLERAVWIEARRLAVGLDTIAEADAELEREVILREQAYRFGIGPRLQLTRAVRTALYGPQHPYRSSLASAESQAGLTLANARWFFARHYVPERVRLVLVGAFDVEAARRIIERHLGTLPASSARPDATQRIERGCEVAVHAGVTSMKRIVVESPYPSERLTYYWPLAPGEDPELWRGTMFVLAESVADAARQVGLSHDVEMGLVDVELGAHWVLDIGVMPGQDLSNLERLVKKMFQDLRHEALDAAWVAAERQRFELSESRQQTNLIGRALGLAKRRCVASKCLPVAEQFSPAALQAFDRFDPDRALIVQQRYRKTAPISGVLEVVP